MAVSRGRIRMSNRPSQLKMERRSEQMNGNGIKRLLQLACRVLTRGERHEVTGIKINQKILDMAVGSGIRVTGFKQKRPTDLGLW